MISYENYPEIFDNVRAVVPEESDSIVDVNSADGQEITAMIPFFGDSAFGAAQKSGTIVVFKENSIYLVDAAAKALGSNPVQKLETNGLGCTAPHSVAASKHGIFFANESGVYVLRRNLEIQYIGEFVERFWTDKVKRDALSLATGHNFILGRRYKLSVPVTVSNRNSDVLVYHHTQEDKGQPGAWTRYTGHNAVGWVNLLEEAFWGSTEGRVLRIRNTGNMSDFRDDDQPIEMEVTFRVMDFGDSGIRKILAHANLHYRVVADLENIALTYAPDLESTFLETTAYDVDRPSDAPDSDSVYKITSRQHSFDRRRVLYVQLRLSCGGKDQPLEVTGVEYRVAALSHEGIRQAGSSTT